MSVYSDVYQFRGTHFEFGLEQGKKLKQSTLLKNRVKQFQHREKRHFQTDVNEAEKLLNRFAPELLDELAGLAEGLDWSIDQAMRYFSGYYFEYGKSGCSIVTGENYLVRNYDSHPSGYDGRVVLYQPTDGGYGSLGPSMFVTGRTDGMNEKGLVVGYNFTNRIGAGDGFICHTIARILLEKAANVSEAIDLLQSMPHRTSFSYVLFDKNHQSKIVEATPRSVVTRDSLACTNHFHHLTEENRYQNDESIQRLEQIHKKWNPHQSPQNAYQALNQKRASIFQTTYKKWSGTLHTTLYEPDKLTMRISLGADRQPVLLDFNQFLKGEKVWVKKIYGELETNHRFLNDELLHLDKN
ncbi:Predicted choloylglycine hydrolase [Pelagirhabdus alkalitolerans]|uniref:Predicted choloylglycine hydrolase n=1 Tax=Pelagirhabdus alkalitolerans TaxID=1612202 RepID=A0A1G6KF06_9BACI|nr:C45 family peptidase [Pelagirhabdus alkalitolerans]SDC29507.1 Predicted choloylglycine hydrolase [Pelagirhabdus alkalitolerans]